MNKLLKLFLVVFLLASLAVALDHIVVTEPTSDQKLGSTVTVKWDTSQIPTGLKTTDNVSVRIHCGKQSVPPKAVPHEPFTDGKKDIFVPDNSDLDGATCQALIFDEDSSADISGISKSFKLTK
ncbi:hypothetical protein RCL_jg8413.t1 [Rhizophagus clarus]|uniref:Uncharacterized protein n=1 Tax=Rhizophagus clarus TaxID=94130 RepID=A0A8H3M9H7_9GLOM|nr:hypothetical protein RCL_jg8413.t1 [Rhizophagus clarus]